MSPLDSSEDDGPQARYRRLVREGQLDHDPMQALAVEKLQSLYRAVEGYKPSLGKQSWAERFGLARRREEPPQGLYLYGDVGRGKSMLMDLFFRTVHVEQKRRVHFHAFMRDVHAQVHAWRKAGAAEKDDLIPALARSWAAQAWVLCLDELEVRDIADAMIVGRLFEALFAQGIVILTTSNRPPEDLYKDGLQRDRFVPFIGLIRENLGLLELASPIDHRLGKAIIQGRYQVPHDESAEATLTTLFLRASGGEDGDLAFLEHQGRSIVVPEAAGGAARFSFADLCEKPLGPGDYLKVATAFHTVVLADVPVLTDAKDAEARRFVTLIDALYDTRTTLIMSAAALPQELYQGTRQKFEFSRTVSRLLEMQSEAWG